MIDHVPDDDFILGEGLQRHMERLSEAFAMTRGTDHAVVYANAAFRRVTGSDATTVGRPITSAFAGRDTDRLIEVLDRVLRTGAASRDQRIDSLTEGAPTWCCTVWPELEKTGRPEHLLVEVRETVLPESPVALLREVAERMLLGALREYDAAENAKANSRRSLYLAEEGRRLAQSLDERATLNAVSRLTLPWLGSWCMVDLIGIDGTMRRLAIIHPDPAKQALLRELEGQWSPQPQDPFGVPAVLSSSGQTVVVDASDETLVTAAHGAETLRVLREVGLGAVLTAPLAIRDRLVGAVTFVSGQSGHVYTKQDVELAEELAIRSAMALDSARLHGEALALKVAAEAASQAKSAFLGTMSHELRTPLNAIGGYVDLIAMGLRGPVTDAQHLDLDRIRSNQQHLMGLISDILNLVHVGSGLVQYEIADVPASEVLAQAVAMVEPLMSIKPVACELVQCVPPVIVRADRDRLVQIIVNLLSNAIKFTPPGGRIILSCTAVEDTVRLDIADTGIGIPHEKLDVIFEPFVQVRDGLAGRDAGVGLGLAISRDLARGMQGKLTVESVVGEGSRFSLTLPRAGAAPGDT